MTRAIAGADMVVVVVVVVTKNNAIKCCMHYFDAPNTCRTENSIRKRKRVSEGEKRKGKKKPEYYYVNLEKKMKE